CLLLLDLASIYNRTSPDFLAGGPSINSRPILWRCVDLFSFAVTSFAPENILHAVISIISVTALYSGPQDWMAPFEYWGDAYTLRRLWGRTWHQFLRRNFSTHGNNVANILGLGKGTNPSAYVQLYTAFFLSIILHVVCDHKVHQSFTPGGSLVFFAIQPFAITLEDFILFMARNMGIKPAAWWRIVGYAWVSAWF
ncbi:membrane bound O-acyl transferase family-domain-containing protein, partial [Mycena crocata]